MAVEQIPQEIHDDAESFIGSIEGFQIYRFEEPHSIEQDWRALGRGDTGNIYQSYNWAKITLRTFEKHNTPCIIVGKDAKGVQFILPMVLEGGFFKVLRWIGGSHANICSGLYSEEFLKIVDKPFMQELFTLIGKSIGGIGKTNLGNQPMEISSYPNPMLLLQHQKSVNKMYELYLENGMDGVLEASNSRRKRKLWRKQNRTADEMGGYELFIPKTDEDIKLVLNEFLKLKAERFKEMGINDVFDNEETKDFLFQSALEPEMDGIKLFEIYQLKVGGKTRAVCAIGNFRDYSQAYINAVSYDDFAKFSPGDMILYAMIEDLIDRKFSKFDLGVGYERYKESWSSVEKEMFDNILPISTASIPYVTTSRIKSDAKRYLRNNAKLWTKYKQIRKLKAKVSGN